MNEIEEERARKARSHLFSGVAAFVVGKEPAAVRRRVLRAWLVRHGVRGSDDAQVRAVDGLVVRWRGQGPPSLPGGLEVIRTRGRLTVRPAITGR